MGGPALPCCTSLMNRFLELCLIFFLQCLILFFVALVPLAWIFRDGLGVESVPTEGLDAFKKAFMTFYVGPILLVLIPFAIFSGRFFKK